MSPTGSIIVHLRVNDADTGKPTPVRLRIAGPDGEYFAPFGRVAEFAVGHNEDVGCNVYLGGKRYTYIDGSCEIRLPTGVPLEIVISKGIAYEPIRERVTLGAGQMALRFVLRRSTDWSTDWISADTRCHFLTPHTAMLEAAAEDLDLVHLLTVEQDLPAQDGHLYRTIPNMTAFSGQQAALEKDGHAVVVNTLNTHPALGRLGLLNCHRPVYPLSFGSDNTDDWSLSDWANQCHRKKGLVVWCDAFRGSLPGGEALVSAILGKIDAIELDAQERSQPFIPSWYRLLNAGVHLSLVGGSGKDSNRIALGSMRTYTATEGGSRSHADWVERTRQGRTFVTNGPFLSLEVNHAGPASELAIEQAQMLKVRARASSRIPYDRLEIIANGEVVGEGGPNGTLEITHSLPEGGWIAARCHGSAKSALDPRLSLLAHTSPIFVNVADRPSFTVPAAIRSLANDVEQVRLWAERDGRYTQEKFKAALLERCDETLRILTSRLAGR